jgi:hypothetical protein
VGIVLATLFTMWTPNNLFSDQILNEMLLAIQTDTQNRKVAGQPLHRDPDRASELLPGIGVMIPGQSARMA